MDKDLIRRRFAKALTTYPGEAHVQQSIARRMVQLVADYTDPSAHRRVLEVGCGTGLFTRQYVTTFHPGEMWANDLCPEAAGLYADMESPAFHFLPGDAEQIGLPDRLSMVVSCSTLQWFESPERFFGRCRAHLDDGGYLIFTTFGRRNMHEVSSATGRSLPYRTADELRKALEAAFEVTYCDESETTVAFDSPLDVLRHLKMTGVTASGAQAWTRRDLAQFCRRYDGGRRTADGRVTLTYHPIYFVTKKK